MGHQKVALILGVILDKKKRERPEDFIGWKSDDGLLEVIDVFEKIKGIPIKYKVICNVCSPDIELFPDGYFVSNKADLKRGIKPCGCSKCPKWDKRQTILRVNRNITGKFKIVRFVGEYNGAKTKIDCECLIDGYKWTTTINCIMNGKGCAKCSKVYKPTEKEALDRCNKICADKNFTSVGFPRGYKDNTSLFEFICPVHGRQTVRYSNFINRKSCRLCGVLLRGKKRIIPESTAITKCVNICIKENYIPVGFTSEFNGVNSKFEYICQKHGPQLVSYHNFTKPKGTRCPCCAVGGGYNPEKEGTFYIVRWIKDDHSFIKFGITNQKLIRRLKQQERVTDYSFDILYSKTTTDGYLPLNLEKHIKHIKDFDIGVMEESVFGDGFTETISETDLDKLLIIVNHWYKEGI